jgi:hypothetical protein
MVLTEHPKAHWSEEHVARLEFYLSRVLQALGKDKEAEKLAIQAREVLERLLPPDHPISLAELAQEYEAVLYDYLVTSGLRISIARETPATCTEPNLPSPPQPTTVLQLPSKRPVTPQTPSKRPGTPQTPSKRPATPSPSQEE